MSLEPKAKAESHDWIPCEFASMHDCSTADGDFCRIYKDPEDCDRYHVKMIVEGEETKEEYQNWLKRNREMQNP